MANVVLDSDSSDSEEETEYQVVCFRAKNSSLASSMLSVALDLSYIVTTNLSRIL